MVTTERRTAHIRSYQTNLGFGNTLRLGVSELLVKVQCCVPVQQHCLEPEDLSHRFVDQELAFSQNRARPGQTLRVPLRIGAEGCIQRFQICNHPLTIPSSSVLSPCASGLDLQLWRFSDVSLD